MANAKRLRPLPVCDYCFSTSWKQISCDLGMRTAFSALVEPQGPAYKNTQTE
ncbi:hypothetical protein GJAV_G00269800 [Gymnothorax javanicus]|nr:hypothetical protein GJAV_G00269800 [Gymnothorax javanicus]